jgi:putative ABC transport system permease protein
MSDAPISVGPVLVAVLGFLALAGTVAVWLGRVGDGRAVLFAAVRATVQLAAVSLLITAVLGSAWGTAGFVVVMFTVAAWTSARRIGTVRTAWRAGAAIGGGVVPVLALLLGTGSVSLRPVVLIPVAGILIGGTMTATSLAGVRALGELTTRYGEYEAALALGFLPRAAALEISRPSAGQALIPALDQTRTVGLVALPGAFIGVLLGGGSPVQAGVTQLLVLITLLASEAVAVLVTVELVARGRLGKIVRH